MVCDRLRNSPHQRHLHPNNKPDSTKKLLLTLLLVAVGIGASYAATVSGTIWSGISCGPANGQKVYLRDTTGGTPYVDSAVTNANGFYSMTFPASWTYRDFQLMMPGCGTIWIAPGYYNNLIHNSVTLNATVCGTPKYLSGTVGDINSQQIGEAKVWLIRVRRNYPTAGDTTLTAVDSVSLAQHESGFQFMRPCTPTDTFICKAALLPANSNYLRYLPTYHDSALSWNNAKRVYGSGFTTMQWSQIHRIQMKSGLNSGGPGFIGGSVLVGANKTTATGDPLPSRIMILTNATTNKPAAFTYTDAAGRFSFSNLAVGSYRLSGDAWGLYNIPLTVSITNTQQAVRNIIFEEHYRENTFKGRFSATSISTTTGPLAELSVFPNPATTTLSLKGVDGIGGSKTVVLRNLLGATVGNHTFADGQPLELRVADLPSGTYILQVITEIGTASLKVVR